MQSYGLQLREKQKVKRIYGVLEKQFRTYFKKAASKKGITGETLLQFLERRLDSVVFRLGFAASRNMARQLVAHGNITINGRKVDVPSCLVNAGDSVALVESMRKSEEIQVCIDTSAGRGTLPSWLELDAESFKGSVKQLPSREDIVMPIQENLIVELYSK